MSLLPFVVSLLYYLCFAFLLGLVAVIAAAPNSLKTPWLPVGPAPSLPSVRRARRLFFTLAFSLLLWQLTLFLEIRTALPVLQLWLGRVNFAAVALTVFLAWRFVQEVAGAGFQRTPPPYAAWSRWLRYGLLLETATVTLLTLLTPLVDAAESVVDGHAITRFGALFPLYLLHALGYLVATLVLAFWMRCRVTDRTVRGQLTLVGSGILATGGIALVTNALLPYGFDDFRFCHIGTLSTLFFLLCVAYAVFVHGLFDVRIVLRATLVYGLLLALVLGGYSSAVFVTTQYLTGAAGADKFTQFVVLFIAFSFDPLRRFLEEHTDRFLFGTVRRRPEVRRRFPYFSG